MSQNTPSATTKYDDDIEKMIPVRYRNKRGFQKTVSVSKFNIDCLQEQGIEVKQYVQDLDNELMEHNPTFTGREREIGKKIRIAVKNKAADTWIGEG